MALDRAEMARRVRAARAYAGFEKQVELGELMQADGHGVTDPGLLERPNSKKPPPPLMGDRLRSISRHTGLPSEWFTEPDLTKLFGSAPDEGRLARIEADLDARNEAAAQLAKSLSSMASKVEELQKGQRDLLTRLGRLERERGGSGN